MGLYVKDGKTQAQIAQTVGLSQQAISKILEIQVGGNTKDRVKLSREDQVAVIRLILNGEKQGDIAKQFDISHSGGGAG